MSKKQKKNYSFGNNFNTVVTALVLAALLFIVFVWGNTAVKRELPIKYEDIISKYASEYELDKFLVLAIIKTESDFNPNAKSSSGACGLMQLLPETVEDITTRLKLSIDTSDLFDVETNICLGCRYMRYLIDRFGTVSLAITAYNGGEGNVKKWQEKYSVNGTDLYTIPYKETANYVKRVMSRYEIYKDLYT